MTNTWTQNYTAQVITTHVTYSVQRRTAFGWEDVWQTTEYLKALAMVVKHRRTQPKAQKVRITVNSKNLYQ